MNGDETGEAKPRTDRPRWRQVGSFLALTFGLTWLLDLAIYLRGGLSIPGLILGLQLQMLLPAFSAIVLGIFFFKESPLHHSKWRELRREFSVTARIPPTAGRGRWFFYYFLLLTAVYALAAIAVAIQPGLLPTLSALTSILMLLGLVLLIGLRLAGGREAMSRVWLSWGRARYWVLFGVAVIAFYGLQTLLNYAFGLGKVADLTSLLPQTGMDANTLKVVLSVQTLFVGPFLGLVVAFGEEYGWRGYLQHELIKMGRVRGVGLLGVIWGIWHAPIILMGYNYPGHPVLGVLLMTLYTVGLGYFLSYAVLKSGSVLLAAFLHALNNQTLGYFTLLYYIPKDMAFSFGIGIYGLVTLAVITLLILRDPIWREEASSASGLTAGEGSVVRKDSRGIGSATG